MVRLVAEAEEECKRRIKIRIDQQESGKHGESMLPAQLAGPNNVLADGGQAYIADTLIGV